MAKIETFIAFLVRKKVDSIAGSINNSIQVEEVCQLEGVRSFILYGIYLAFKNFKM